MLKRFFITGTDTSVGKTVVSRALLQALASGGKSVAGYKPVAKGSKETAEGMRNKDALVLQSVSSLELPYEAINPIALSEEESSVAHSCPINYTLLSNGLASLSDKVDHVVVEGTGGWRSLMNDLRPLSEWVVQEQLPVLMVVGIQEGCINHALLTAQAVANDGLPLIGWVANRINPGLAHYAEIIDVEGVMVYCHTTGHTIDDVLEDYARHKEQGFKAIRVQCGVPGMKTTYGMAKGKGLAYEPATKGQWPEEQLWSTEKYLDFTPKLFDAVRNTFGFNEHLLHDMHHRLTPIEAARFGKCIEDYRLFWMEDPTPAENQACFRLIRQHTVTPIAVGEVFNSIWDCKQLIEEQLIDYIRTTLTHAGGITGMRRIADFASLYQVRTGSHGPSDLSPVCMAAALHFDLWVPNFGVQEFMGYFEQMLEVFPHNWTFEGGYMHPGDKPGLGIEFDEKLAAKYPYDPAYLPVARLEDGTLWNW